MGGRLPKVWGRLAMMGFPNAILWIGCISFVLVINQELIIGLISSS